jgi:hypothetical protein
MSKEERTEGRKEKSVRAKREKGCVEECEGEGVAVERGRAS